MAEWLNEEANRRKTTKARLIEELIRKEMRAEESPDREGMKKAAEEDFEVQDPSLPYEEIEEDDQGRLVVEAGSKPRADLIRAELSEYLVERDDKRQTRVWLDDEAREKLG